MIHKKHVKHKIQQERKLLLHLQEVRQSASQSACEHLHLSNGVSVYMSLHSAGTKKMFTKHSWKITEVAVGITIIMCAIIRDRLQYIRGDAISLCMQLDGLPLPLTPTLDASGSNAGAQQEWWEYDDDREERIE